MYNKKLIIILLTLTVLLMSITTISAVQITKSDNMTKTSENTDIKTVNKENIKKDIISEKNKFSNINTKSKNILNICENTSKKIEKKEHSINNKSIQEESYSVTVNSKTVPVGVTNLTATVQDKLYHSIVNTGYVYFYIDGKHVGHCHPDKNIASITYTFTKEGTYHFYAEYMKSRFYYSNNVRITVTKFIPFKAILSMNSDTILEGTPLKYPILVRNSSNKKISEGKIQFYINDLFKIQKSVSEGETIINIGTLKAGTYKLGAVFISDNYKTVNLTKILTVKSNKVNIDINTGNTLKPTENLIIKTKIKSLDGEPVGNNGYLSLYLNDKFIKKEKVTYAQATFNLGKQKEGIYKINAIYERPKFVTKNQTKTISIKDVPEIIKLDLPSITSSESTIKIIARATKDNKRVTNGKIKIVANWKTIFEKKEIPQGLAAVFYKTPIKSGNITIVAQYLKNGKIISQDKKNITNYAPQITLFMPTKSDIDKNIKIIAKVTKDEKPVYYGQIKIMVNGKILYNKKNNQGLGAVFYKTPNLGGEYTITTQFINNGKIISQDQQLINVSDTETIDYQLSEQHFSNEKVTLKAYVSKPGGIVNNGQVIFRLNGQLMGIKDVKNGYAVMTYTLPNYNIHTNSTAEYVKNGKVISTSTKKIDTFQYIVELRAPNIAYRENHTTLTAYVRNKENSKINSGKISIYIENEMVGALNVENNTASGSIYWTRDLGVYSITARYMNENGDPSSNLAKVDVKVDVDPILNITLYEYSSKESIGSDAARMKYYYNNYSEKIFYVELSYPRYHDASLPTSNRLIQINTYYSSESGNIITKTTTAYDVYDYYRLMAPTINGYTPYKMDVYYRKMTPNEKKELEKIVYEPLKYSYPVGQ